MKQQIKRAAMLLLGWAFILLGIAGLFLPILQGVLFLLIGLLILSTEYVWAHRLLQRLKQRFPAVAAQFDKAVAKAQRWMHRDAADPAPHAAPKAAPENGEIR